MPEWFRYDLGLVAHPKFRLIPERHQDRARVLYLVMIEFAARFETDGWVPGSEMRPLGMSVGNGRVWITLSELVEAGLVHALDEQAELEVVCKKCAESGATSNQVASSWSPLTSRKLQRGPAAERRVYYVHDYLEKQKSRSWWEAKRLQEKERQRRSRGGPLDQTLDDELSRRDVPYPEAALSRRDSTTLSRGPQNRTAEEQEQELALGTTTRASRPRPNGDGQEPGTSAAALETTQPGQAPSIEAVAKAVAQLRTAAANTSAVVLPLALELTTAEFDQIVADVQASNAVNDAGLLVTLLKRQVTARHAETTRRTNVTGQPEPDDQTRRQTRLDQIAADPDQHIATYARSLGRLAWGEAEPHVAKLLAELPVDADQRAQLHQIAEQAHAAA